MFIDPNDTQLAPCYLGLAAMKGHKFVTTSSTLENIVFRVVFANGREKEVPLPQPSLLSVDRRP